MRRKKSVAKVSSFKENILDPMPLLRSSFIVTSADLVSQFRDNKRENMNL